MTYKLYPVRFSMLEVKGDEKALAAYLNKNAERLQIDYGVLRAKMIEGDRKGVHNVRVEFPVCEIDNRATEKFRKIIEEMKAKGLKCNEVTTIKSEMVGTEDFPYVEIGNKIWKLHGQQKKAYEIGNDSFSGFRILKNQ